MSIFKNCTLMTTLAVMASVALVPAFAGDDERDNPSSCPGKFKPEGADGPLWGVLTDKVFEFQLGDVGITMGLMPKSDFCEVLEVKSSFKSVKSYFRKGDKIVKINGKPTEVWGMNALTWNGEGGTRQFGEAIKLRKPFFVEVKRQGKTYEIEVRLDKKTQAYGEKLATCPRVFVEKEQMDKYLKDEVAPNGFIGGTGKQGTIMSTLHALSIMNSNDKKNYKVVHDMFSTMKDKDALTIPSSWELCYYTTFMCEYYKKFNKPAALKQIKLAIKNLEDRTTDKGKHGHGTDVGYHGGGINAISAHVYLNFVLAEKCNVPVDRKKKKAVKDWIIRCTGGKGNVGYASAGGGDAGYRTPLANIAYRLDGEKDLAKRTAEYMVSHMSNVMSGHALATIPMTWSFIALKGMGEKDKYLDEHFRNLHWYFSITKAPDSYKSLHRFYVPASRSDSYFKATKLNHIVHSTIFSMKSSNLMMTSDGKKKSDKIENMIESFAKNMKDDDKTLDYLDLELGKFTEPDQFIFTVKFLKKKMASARTKVKAKAIYGKVYSKSEKEFEVLKNFIDLRPGFSYDRMKFLSKAFTAEDLGKDIKVFLKSNEDIERAAVYGTFKADLDKITNSKYSDRSKQIKLQSLQKKLVKYLATCPPFAFELRHDLGNLRTELLAALDSVTKK